MTSIDRTFAGHHLRADELRQLDVGPSPQTWYAIYSKIIYAEMQASAQEARMFSKVGRMLHEKETGEKPDDNSDEDIMPARLEQKIDARVPREVIDAIEADLKDSGHLTTVCRIPEEDGEAEHWSLVIQFPTPAPTLKECLAAEAEAEDEDEDVEDK